MARQQQDEDGEQGAEEIDYAEIALREAAQFTAGYLQAKIEGFAIAAGSLPQELGPRIAEILFGQGQKIRQPLGNSHRVYRTRLQVETPPRQFVLPQESGVAAPHHSGAPEERSGDNSRKHGTLINLIRQELAAEPRITIPDLTKRVNAKLSPLLQAHPSSVRSAVVRLNMRGEIRMSLVDRRTMVELVRPQQAPAASSQSAAALPGPIAMAERVFAALKKGKRTIEQLIDEGVCSSIQLGALTMMLGLWQKNGTVKAMSRGYYKLKPEATRKPQREKVGVKSFLLEVLKHGQRERVQVKNMFMTRFPNSPITALNGGVNALCKHGIVQVSKDNIMSLTDKGKKLA